MTPNPSKSACPLCINAAHLSKETCIALHTLAETHNLQCKQIVGFSSPEEKPKCMVVVVTGEVEVAHVTCALAQVSQSLASLKDEPSLPPSQQAISVPGAKLTPEHARRIYEDVVAQAKGDAAKSKPSPLTRLRRWVARRLADKPDAVDQRIERMRNYGGPTS